MTATFINIHGKADVAHTRADLMRHPAFAGLDTDSDGNPRVWLNSYTCQSCTSEQIDWTDTWSCGCDDDCPQCGASHSPTDQQWLPACEVHGPEYCLWESLPEKPMQVRSLYGMRVTEVEGRVIEQPVIMAPEDAATVKASREPIGRWDSIEVDEKGVYLRGRVFKVPVRSHDPEAAQPEVADTESRRRLATILAALRFWQAAPDDWKAARFMDVATDGGEIEPMSSDQIDRLCEEINNQIEADPSF